MAIECINQISFAAKRRLWICNFFRNVIVRPVQCKKYEHHDQSFYNLALPFCFDKSVSVLGFGLQD